MHINYVCITLYVRILIKITFVTFSLSFVNIFITYLALLVCWVGLTSVYRSVISHPFCGVLKKYILVFPLASFLNEIAIGTIVDKDDNSFLKS